MAQSRNFKEYDDVGVRFIYPNNWSVQTETWGKGRYGVSVDSPEGSFWALSIFPRGVDLGAATDEILAALKIEYDDLEEEEIVRYVADRVLKGREINFFYLDMTCTVQALTFETENAGYVIYWQTADRMRLSEDDDVSQIDVFKVITHTLISNLTNQEIDYWEDENEAGAFDMRSQREILDEEGRAERIRRYMQRRRELDAERERFDLPPIAAGVDGFLGVRERADSDVADFIRDSADVFDGKYDDEYDDEDDEYHGEDDEEEGEYGVEEEDYEEDDE